ncbi:hypothetical protein DXC97_20400 [Lachnospiraceae bacterium TF09-5]|nr:hypothetical protein DXC97_20400 [Lachnospiraceae bacterium TF09-5]
MKLINLLIICLLSSLIVIGCGKDNQEEIPSTIDIEAQAEEHRIRGEELQQKLQDLTKDDIESESTDSETNEIIVYPIQLNEFSEGLAWVRGNRSDNGENVFVLIDENGKVIFVENESLIYASECQDGMIYIRKMTEEGIVESIVIDSDGNELFCSKDINNSNVLGYGDGVFVVGKRVAGFDINETQIGLVDVDGKWIKEMSTDIFNIDSNCVIDNVENGKENTLQYLGDGIFEAHNKDNLFQYVFYNSVDDVSFALNGYWGIDGGYYNGKILVYNTRDYGFKGVHSLDKYGNLTMISEGVENNKIGIYSDGLWYYSGGFFNINGDKVIDINQYKDRIESVRYPYPKFKDGYAVLVLKGDDNNAYYTVLDMNGEIMFEPRILELAYYKEGSGVIGSDDCTSPGEMNEQLFSIYENGRWSYYNVKGERIIEINVDIRQYSKISAFNPNIALLIEATSNASYYVGKDGNIKIENIILPFN